MEQIQNAMSVDVEDYFHVTALAGSIDRSHWQSLEYRAEASTDRLLEIFARRCFSATFFVLGWVAKRSPNLVRRIHAAGHEIACHGMSHKLVYDQGREEFARETAEAKALLENVTGTQVFGYRAASYSITNRSLWALDTLVEAGFTYDSSVFPVRHDIYGIPGSPRRPHRLLTPSGEPLIEFPISTTRAFGITLPVSGGGYFRIFPYALIRAGLHAINRGGDPFVFYLHPWEIDPEQPRISAPMLSRLRHYTNLRRTEPRLLRLIGDFKFSTIRQVLMNCSLIDSNGLRQTVANT